jgi:hypothetical protein
MPSEFNHIDEFYRRKEKESVPDLDHQEMHWQQMKQMMVPAQPPANGMLSKLAAVKTKLFIIGFSAIIVTTTVFVLSRPHKSSSIKTKNQTASLPKKKDPLKKQQIFVLPYSAAAWPQKVRLQRKDNRPPGTTASLTLASNDIAAVSPDTVQSLSSEKVYNQFFQSLQKPAEEFIVNSGRDTTIYCREGSSIFIPAGSFQLNGTPFSGIVQFRVTEFYEFSDIVVNKLTTTSDGQPLSSGGMLHIEALSGNRELQLKPGQSLELNMPAPNYDSQMGLFVEAGNTKPSGTNSSGDTVLNTLSGSTIGINWIANGQQQFSFNKLIKVFNLRDDPYNIVYRNGKTLARFSIPKNCPWTNDQMKAELIKRYGDRYDKIKVIRHFPFVIFSGSTFLENMIGDTISISIQNAMRNKLITREDSVKYEEQFAKMEEDYRKGKLAYSQFLQVKDQYNFKIPSTGWVNCDRFLKYNADKMEEVQIIPLKDFEDKYLYTVMVFKTDKAILPGTVSNGRIRFPKIPRGQEVSIICMGVKDGKAWTEVKEITISKDVINLQLEETSPAEFRQQLSRLGSVSKKG